MAVSGLPVVFLILILLPQSRSDSLEGLNNRSYRHAKSSQSILAKYKQLDPRLVEKLEDYTDSLLQEVDLLTDDPSGAAHLIGTKLDVQSAYWTLSAAYGSTLKGSKLPLERIKSLIQRYIRAPCSNYAHQMHNVVESFNASTRETLAPLDLLYTKQALARYAICAKLISDDSDWLADELYRTAQMDAWKPQLASQSL